MSNLENSGSADDGDDDESGSGLGAVVGTGGGERKKKVGKLSGVDFMSTHPANSKRIAALEKWMPEVSEREVFGLFLQLIRKLPSVDSSFALLNANDFAKRPLI